MRSVVCTCRHIERSIPANDDDPNHPSAQADKGLKFDFKDSSTLAPGVALVTGAMRMWVDDKRRPNPRNADDVFWRKTAGQIAIIASIITNALVNLTVVRYRRGLMRIFCCVLSSRRQCLDQCGHIAWARSSQCPNQRRPFHASHKESANQHDAFFGILHTGRLALGDWV
jgi:hypothetical protein